MKVRNGFVSNSSSSSFIVSLDKDAPTKITLSVEVDLAQYGEVIKTVNELDEKIKEEYWQEDDGTMRDYYQEQYDEMKSAIENGQVVIWGQFCDEGEAEENFLCCRGLKGQVEEDKINIIQNESGY